MREEYELLRKLGWGRLLLYLGFASLVTGGLTGIATYVGKDQEREIVECQIASEIVRGKELNSRLSANGVAKVTDAAARKLIDCMEI